MVFSLISGKIKEHDLFGHAIALNFNRQGDRHNTIIGGLISLVIKAAMTVFLISNIHKLITYDDDTINTTKKKIDLTEAGALKYDGKKQLYFWVLSNTAGGPEKSVYLHDEQLKPKDPAVDKAYLDVEFIQERVNWHNRESKDPEKPFLSYETLGAR